MLIKTYDPQKGKRLQILDPQGKVVDAKLEPKLSKEQLLKMYRTMVLERVADIKALQFQRQGRMLTYALNKGQEAAQVGAAAAMEKQDWVSPAFREVGIYLYKGVPLENIYLYWYGNENGSKMDPEARILPVNIIIGSQINLGAGLAMASKIQGKNEVTLATIGDAGSSHGEFYEGLNYAASFKAPYVVMIQNNQYGISTPRRKATAAETLAQKAVAFGIPGIQVDGNDVLAVYAATKEAFDRARNGEGPTLIEAYTYRMGAHTTNDDPTLYRSREEEAEWDLKDPIARFKAYLIDKGHLTEEENTKLEEEINEEVIETFKKVESYGTNVDLLEVFEHTYAEMTPQLKEQYEEHKAFLAEKEGK
ncbi:Pyruvate dehydrogenase E1 component, alpha subunit (AcoA/PdhA) [Alteracholeplasma palmae J233]|uniref:Pyruvate dehydrogenase E1 component subunit alpha n=1 Tax=Alteracholeplasma palmae (strain ATCC 49389 / J233) TaxID=1318466 RepID=U4KJV2_ALTPJ|nr:pyruvate dehydrogenase (acetyl-transferring) E1 component subunit alpha [Alteracholeplasma palmae]CCV63728.1 Pyruvate dehydrogenase E1 component, alpha subunit (AcoA/PdhA) [Alteracholeplasma palmae J233]